jgi:hypothetical protein
MHRYLVAVLALACLPSGALATSSATSATGPRTEPAPAPRFGEEIAVRLVTVVARVVDGAGNPILGLAPGDFRVRVGRREVPVAAVDWVATGEPAADLAKRTAAGLAATGAAAAAGGAAKGAGQAAGEAGAAAATTAGAVGVPAAPLAPVGSGKLVVFFVQADNNAPSRVRGHLRTLPFTRELLAALQPEDRVAVVSFDSHLKLWQDFTRELEPLPAVIYQAIHFGGDPAGQGGHAPDAVSATATPAAVSASTAAATAAAAASPDLPSLVRHLDAGEALRAASPERALAVTAEALAALPGEKVLVFLGWGLGSFDAMGVHMTPAFAPAVRALAAARATVFVLDVTEADAHSLEVGLRAVAEATGGTYDKTNVFPALAVRQLARTISGYYLLALDAAALPKAGGSVEVELRGRRGTVLQRPLSLPAG